MDSGQVMARSLTFFMARNDDMPFGEIITTIGRYDFSWTSVVAWIFIFSFALGRLSATLSTPKEMIDRSRPVVYSLSMLMLSRPALNILTEKLASREQLK